jgi:L-aspartate oxidase
MKCDILIAGSGVAGLYTALCLPTDKKVILITKDELAHSDSYLAQGGICYWKSDDDFDSFFMDTMRAGHFENDPMAVRAMIEDSRVVIADMESCGTRFQKENGAFLFTKEGAHRTNRILYHADETGKEITAHLLSRVQELPNVTILEYTTLVDILTKGNRCIGAVIVTKDKETMPVYAHDVMMATGGIGGLYKHSTNYRHLTGDALRIAKKHNVHLKNLDYVQIHPTTLYSKKPGRRFLISESVRGEGAHLLNSKGERFVNELLPRDVVTSAIRKEMAKEGTDHVWIDMRMLGDELQSHFPNIYARCKEEGYDPLTDLVPVVPAQHYFMGGIEVDLNSETSMKHLYAAGETACNGVHGANRLASNSLLESLVFARRAALHMTACFEDQKEKGTINKKEKDAYQELFAGNLAG